MAMLCTNVLLRVNGTVYKTGANILIYLKVFYTKSIEQPKCVDGAILIAFSINVFYSNKITIYLCTNFLAGPNLFAPFSLGTGMVVVEG